MVLNVMCYYFETLCMT